MQRKKSPRAPSMSLGEAIKRALEIFDKEKLHTISTDVAAIDMGYKDAKSGSSKQAIGALKAFGLLISPKSGHVSITNMVQKYLFDPDKNTKLKVMRDWLESPAVYAALLAKYKDNLPSSAQLKYDLLEMGFSPKAADECVDNFVQSVEYANYYGEKQDAVELDLNDEEVSYAPDDLDNNYKSSPKINSQQNIDRIPIRLSGGRRAWLEIPTPYYEKDKKVIKDQVDLIVTDEEEIDE